jgi:hypothetical protein
VRKRFALLAILIFVGVASFLWFSQIFFLKWEPRIRADAENKLTAALKTRVHIERITLRFPHRIALENVEIYDIRQTPPVLIGHIKTVYISLNILNLPGAFLHHQPADAISLISLDSPWIVFQKDLFQNSQVASPSDMRLPLLFTLAWDNGIFQWKDVSGPSGIWELNHSHGALRIRGPRISLDLKAAADPVRQINMHLAALGKRWSLETELSGVRLPQLAGIISRFTRFKLPDPTWSLDGELDIKLSAQGKWPIKGSIPNYLREGNVTLRNVRLNHGNAAPLEANGAFLLKGKNIYLSQAAFRLGKTSFRLNGTLSPFGENPSINADLITQNLDLSELNRYFLGSQKSSISGLCSAKLHLAGPLAQPETTLEGTAVHGYILQQPFQDAAFHVRHVMNHWEFGHNRLTLLQGQIGLTGLISADNIDLRLTGKNLALAGFAGGKTPIEGLANFAVVAHGTVDDPRATGSFWIDRFGWKTSPLLTMRGRIEIDPAHLFLQASSSDNKLRLRSEAIRYGKAYKIQYADLNLPSGSELTSSGVIDDKRADISWKAENISLADDIPAIKSHWPLLNGRINSSGRIEGPLENPVLRATLHSGGITWGARVFQHADASILINPQGLSELSFAAVPGCQGKISFTVSDHNLKLGDIRIDSDDFSAKLHGDASWPNDLPAAVRFRTEGMLSYSGKGPAWSFPFSIAGDFDLRENGKGRAEIYSGGLTIKGLKTDPLTGRLRWGQENLIWENLRWGKYFNSNGRLHFASGQTEISGVMDANQFAMARWQTMLWPNLKEPVSGFLNGRAVFSGTLSDPRADLSVHMTEGRWREFRFEGDGSGHWTRNGIDPIAMHGRLAGGGEFMFKGRVLPETGTANGTLQFANFELRPLGASLSFPQPLYGRVGGTLTVTGLLTQLRLAGHLAGGPIQYGAGKNPLRLQNCAFDMTLAPAPDLPAATRFTLTHAVFKTVEEEVRLNPDSYIEFSPSGRSRIDLGMELRNLHLGFFTLFGGADIRGSWEIRPEGFAYTGDAHTRSLYINDYELEEGNASLSYYNGTVIFSPPGRGGRPLVTGTVDFRRAPEIHFTDFFIAAKSGLGLNIAGDIGPSLWDFRVQGDGVDMGTIASLTGSPYPLEGTASINIQGHGSQANPRVDGEISVEDGKALALHFASGEAEFIWENHRITFTRLILIDPGRYTLTGAGVFPFDNLPSASQQVNFSVRLKDSNLSLLKSIAPEVKDAHGSVQGLLQVTGTMDNPVMQGSLRIKNGDATGAHYFRHLKNIYMALDFTGQHLVVHQLRAESGNGSFVCSGSVAFSGLEPRFYDLHLDIPTARGVEVTVPELAIPESPLARKFHFLTTVSRCDVNGHVDFHGPAEAPVFTGTAFLSNGHFTFPPSSKNPPSRALTEWFRRINWDVNLKFKDGAWFENELVEAALVGGLRLKGSSDNLRVDGGMDIPQGKISYLGIDFDIQTARFDLKSSLDNGAIMNTPYVRGIATSQVQTVDQISGLGIDDTITLNIDYAPINEIKPHLVSAQDPTLAQDKVLSRVTQLEVTNLTQQERTYLYQQQMVRLIDTSLATPLARNLLKRTGLVDQLQVSRVINPANVALPSEANNPNNQQQTAANLFAGTKYTLSKNISERLSLGYGLRFEEITMPDYTSKLDLQSDVEVSYRMLQNIYLKGSFDLPNSTPGILPDRKVTIEPRWRFGWWGNTNKEKIKSPDNPNQ